MDIRTRTSTKEEKIMADGYRGVPFPTGYETSPPEIQEAWRNGVDDALSSRRDISGDTGALKITGWTREAVRAFAHVSEDDPDTARRIIRGLSGADRAVLAFWLNELSGIVDDEELTRRAEARRRGRTRPTD
jgi:hypothetical protein